MEKSCPPEYVLIIHGWSDDWKSFKDLGKVLAATKKFHDPIFYSYYESRSDGITFTDLAKGLQKELEGKGLLGSDVNLNIVVHSTGALVIREWLTTYYPDGTNCPVKRILMLAPANFGSPLAHKATSPVGYMAKGKFRGGREVGQVLLKGLEIGSPYLWDLAERDLLTSENVYYSKDRIMVTVIVGRKDYNFFSAVFTGEGTDGTVYVSGTKMKTVKYILNLKNADKPSLLEPSRVDGTSNTGFLILDDVDHSTIVSSVAKNKPLQDAIVDALSVQSAEFHDEQKGYLAKFKQSFNMDVGYQLWMFRAVDEERKPVEDYAVIFIVMSEEERANAKNNYIEHCRNDRKTLDFNAALKGHWHRHSDENGYRALLCNVGNAMDYFKTLPVCHLGVFVYLPQSDPCFWYQQQLNPLWLYTTGQEKEKIRFLCANVTTLVEIVVPRMTKCFAVSPEDKDLEKALEEMNKPLNEEECIIA